MDQKTACVRIRTSVQKEWRNNAATPLGRADLTVRHTYFRVETGVRPGPGRGPGPAHPTMVLAVVLTLVTSSLPSF